MTVLTAILTFIGGSGVITLITLLVKVSMDYSKLKTIVEEIREDNKKLQDSYEKLLKDIELKNKETLKNFEEKIRDLELKLNTAKEFIDKQLNTLYDFRLQASQELATVSAQLIALKESIDNQFATVNQKLDNLPKEK